MGARCEYFRAPLVVLKLDGLPVAAQTDYRESKSADESFAPCGKVVAGLATAYFEYHNAMSGQNEIFARGCFDASLKVRPQVELLLSHKAEFKIAHAAFGGRMEVHSDLDGLWFRWWPTESKRDQVTVDAVADGTLCEVSIGYRVERESFFKAHGIDRRMIHEAVLGEISLLPRDWAAVRSTKVILVDATDVKTEIRDDIERGVLRDLRARIRSEVP